MAWIGNTSSDGEASIHSIAKIDTDLYGPILIYKSSGGNSGHEADGSRQKVSHHQVGLTSRWHQQDGIYVLLDTEIMCRVKNSTSTIYAWGVMTH